MERTGGGSSLDIAAASRSASALTVQSTCPCIAYPLIRSATSFCLLCPLSRIHALLVTLLTASSEGFPKQHSIAHAHVHTWGSSEAVMGNVAMHAPLQPSARRPPPAASDSGTPAGSPMRASIRKREAPSCRSYHLSPTPPHPNCIRHCTWKWCMRDDQNQ